MLVSFLEERKFSGLGTKRPDWDEIEREARARNSEVTENEIRKTYSIEATLHNRNLGILARLHDYGETRDEIIATLREHLESCRRCREEYSRKLDEEANRKARKDGVYSAEDYKKWVGRLDILSLSNL